MSNQKSSLKLKIQTILDKTKSLANIRSDIKAIESKLPRIKIRGALNMTATRKELNSKLKNINPKIKVDTDTSKAAQKMKKLEKQKTDTTIQHTVDNSQIKSGLKETQKETKSFFNKFLNDDIRTNLIRMGVQQVIQAISQAISGIKELDTMKTNLQMTSGLSDSKADIMMGSYNLMAKELSTTTKSISETANELLCIQREVLGFQPTDIDLPSKDKPLAASSTKNAPTPRPSTGSKPSSPASPPHLTNSSKKAKTPS